MYNRMLLCISVTLHVLEIKVIITFEELLAYVIPSKQGAQWLSGRKLDSKPRGRGFEPHRRHCVVVLEQDTFILDYNWFNAGRPIHT